MSIVSVLPEKVDLQVVWDTDNPLEIQLKINGSPEQIVDDTVTFRVVAKKGDATALLELSNGPGEHSDPMVGKTIFDISSDLLKTLDGDRGQKLVLFFAVSMTRGISGAVNVYIEGKFMLETSASIFHA